jgi:hypothetical protein
METSSHRRLVLLMVLQQIVFEIPSLIIFTSLISLVFFAIPFG